MKRLFSERSAGIGLLVLVLLTNPWALGRLTAPDGSIDGEARIRLVLLINVFCALSGVVLLWRRPRAWLRQSVRHASAAAALIALLSMAIVGTWWGIAAYRGAHHHTMDMRDMQPPTAEQQQWASEFVQRCWESARRHGWLDFDAAAADGYQLQWGDRAHYLNRDYLFDEAVLDPDRPEFLMYEPTPKGKLLVGFMFFARTVDEHGPPLGGSLAPWHYHPWGPRGYCAEGGLIPFSRPDGMGRCPEGVRVMRSAEMLHVWFIDHPLGPYADAMLFPDSASVVTPTLIHPMVVHFAIALLIVAVFLDLLGKVANQPSLHSAAFVNLALGGVFAIAAVAAGMLAEVRLLITPAVHQVLDTHKLLGFSACGGIVLLLAWRLFERGRFPRRGGLAYLAAGLAVAGLVGGAGYFGSKLVYVNGVAVQAIDREALERHERVVFGGAPAADAPGPMPAMDVHAH